MVSFLKISFTLYLIDLSCLFMPELPEVETTIRYLSLKVKEKKIIKIFKSDKRLRKNLTITDILSINGQKISDIKRIY